MVQVLISTLVCAILVVGAFANNTTTAEAATTTAATNTSAAMTTSAATTMTTVVANTTVLPGVSNNADRVSAEISLPGSFSAITNQTQFKAEVKTQIASKLSVNEDQIQNLIISNGSVIVKFQVIKGSGSNPANAVAQLKTLVTSGALAITTSDLGSVTANPSHFVAVDFDSTTPIQSGLSCFVCNGTTHCNSDQKSMGTKNNCKMGQTCWIDRVKTSAGVYHRRYCGSSCSSMFQKEYCTSTSSQMICRKCCSTANCNVDVLTGGSGLVGTSWSLMLSLLIVTGWLTL